MVGLRRAEAELQTALPNPQGSGLFHSHSASQALNHFPLHYKKTFVFLHPHPLPLKKTVMGFNHLSERMCLRLGEVSTVMSSVQAHTNCHPRDAHSTPGVPNITHAKETQSRLTIH